MVSSTMRLLSHQRTQRRLTSLVLLAFAVGAALAWGGHAWASVSRRQAAAAAAATAAAVSSQGNTASAEDGKSIQYPILGDENIMAGKAHGTSPRPVQESLRWNVDRSTADRICSFNRDFAEYAGYFRKTSFIEDLKQISTQEAGAESKITFYDSVTGKPLFVAPRGRTVKEFLKESLVHGWPSFRDQEVVWENVRCLRNGECISVDGTHLGHDIPDGTGNRYCINLVSVAGQPSAVAKAPTQT